METREINVLPSLSLPPDKTAVPAATCLREAPSGAGLRLPVHQLHGMPPRSFAGYDNASVSREPGLVHRTTTFKAHGNRVICLFNINKQDTNKRRGEEKQEVPGRDGRGA